MCTLKAMFSLAQLKYGWTPGPSTKHPDMLGLLPLVKRQVFCIGDRLKMDKHKAFRRNHPIEVRVDHN